MTYCMTYCGKQGQSTMEGGNLLHYYIVRKGLQPRWIEGGRTFVVCSDIVNLKRGANTVAFTKVESLTKNIEIFNFVLVFFPLLESEYVFY